jgi:hypothetical protein
VSYLGHESIQHTVRYTELAPTRSKSLFRDERVQAPRCAEMKSNALLVAGAV